MKTLQNISDVIKVITLVDIKKENSRLREVVDARRIYGYLARKLTKYSSSEIGKFIGKDHSTILHYERTARELMRFDRDFKENLLMCLRSVAPIVEQSQYLEEYKYHKRKADYYKQKLRESENNGID